MHYLNIILVAVSAFSAVSAAPTGVNKDLLELGQTVQQFNALFRTIQPTDPCESGTSACVNGTISTCSETGQWVVARRGRCTAGRESCFAVPDKQLVSINLACMSEASALERIQLTGVPGGLFGGEEGSGNTTSTSTGIEASSTAFTSPSPTTRASATKTATSSTPVSAPQTSTATSTVPATATVTVQVTVFPTEPVTVTTTISPSEASEILSSASVSSTPTSTSTSVLGSTPSTTVPTTIASASSSSVIVIVTTEVRTIQLTLPPNPSATTTSEAAVATRDAIPALAPPVRRSRLGSVGFGGGFGASSVGYRRAVQV